MQPKLSNRNETALQHNNHKLTPSQQSIKQTRKQRHISKPNITNETKTQNTKTTKQTSTKPVVHQITETITNQPP